MEAGLLLEFSVWTMMAYVPGPVFYCSAAWKVWGGLGFMRRVRVICDVQEGI